MAIVRIVLVSTIPMTSLPLLKDQINVPTIVNVTAAEDAHLKAFAKTVSLSPTEDPICTPFQTVLSATKPA